LPVRTARSTRGFRVPKKSFAPTAAAANPAAPSTARRPHLAFGARPSSAGGGAVTFAGARSGKGLG
jgi:hypothetical protein